MLVHTYIENLYFSQFFSCLTSVVKTKSFSIHAKVISKYILIQVSNVIIYAAATVES